jgi:hypothetical protein
MAIFDLEQVTSVRSMLESKAGSVDSSRSATRSFLLGDDRDSGALQNLWDCISCPNFSIRVPTIVILFSQVGFNLLTQSTQLMPEYRNGE